MHTFKGVGLLVSNNVSYHRIDKLSWCHMLFKRFRNILSRIYTHGYFVIRVFKTMGPRQ